MCGAPQRKTAQNCQLLESDQNRDVSQKLKFLTHRYNCELLFLVVNAHKVGDIC